MTRVLFAVQHFRQGWGGAPESVRLMARALSTQGVASDVYDRGSIVRDVGSLSLLPVHDCGRNDFDFSTATGYRSIIQTGPWQSPLGLLRLRRARQNAHWIYLPRGGLAQVEFSRPRDVKKLPYLALIERRFIAASDAVVFSSETEQRHTLHWSFSPSQAVVIPDFVAPPRSRALADEGSRAVVTFAFLAEISPRKGLQLLVDAFIAWVQSRGLETQVRLKVGGAPRPGSESHLATIRARHAAVGSDGVQIEFLGAVPHGERGAFYAATDVMVVASSFESFGLTVFEAMAEGCVVLSTPDVGALEQTEGMAGVITASAPTLDALHLGFDNALHAHFRITRDARAAEAQQGIERSNALALASWQKLLGIG